MLTKNNIIFTILHYQKKHSRIRSEASKLSLDVNRKSC